MNLRERLPELAWDRPVTVFMVFLACLVVGMVAAWRIPVQMMPSGFEPGRLWVWVPYPNAGPSEVDERIRPAYRGSVWHRVWDQHASQSRELGFSDV